MRKSCKHKHHASRWLCLIPVLALGLAGCGSGAADTVKHVRQTKTVAGRPDPKSEALIRAAIPEPGGVRGTGPVVMKIRGVAIRKAVIDSKMAIEARVESRNDPIVPVPPAYLSCIAKLKEAAGGVATTSNARPSTEQLRAQCAQLYERFRKHILTELISSEWVIGEAAEQGLTASDAEARRLLRHESVGPLPGGMSFADYLAATGENASDLLFDAKVQLLSTKIRQKIAMSVPPVTQSTIARYYAANRRQFIVSETRDLGMIRTQSVASAARVKRELESGATFEQVARGLRHQPLFTENGLLKGLRSGVFHEKALNQAIFAARPHVVTGPVRLDLFPGVHPRFQRNPNDINNIDGYYVFEVEAIHSTEAIPPGRIEAQIKQKLPTIEQEHALVKFISAMRARWRPRTDCSRGYVVRKCRQFKAPPGEPPEDPYTLG